MQLTIGANNKDEGFWWIGHTVYAADHWLEWGFYACFWWERGDEAEARVVFEEVV